MQLWILFWWMQLTWDLFALLWKHFYTLNQNKVFLVQKIVW